MRKIYMKFAAVLLLTTFSFQLFAQKDLDKLKSEIEGINAKVIKANIAGDMEAISEFYAEDVYYLPNYGPMVKGKDATIAHGKESVEAGYKMLSMNLETLEVIPAKDMIIEVGKYALSMSIPEMPMPVADQGKYVTVWQRQKDGSLKMKIETWNTDVNPMEMGKEMMKKKEMEIKEKEKVKDEKQ
jgi:ketosteroid isomerase-like protein